MESSSISCGANGCSFILPQSLLDLGLFAPDLLDVASTELPPTLRGLPNGLNLDLNLTSFDGFDALFVAESVSNAASDASHDVVVKVAFNYTCTGLSGPKYLQDKRVFPEVGEWNLNKSAVRKLVVDMDEGFISELCAGARNYTQTTPDERWLCDNWGKPSMRNGKKELSVEAANVDGAPGAPNFPVSRYGDDTENMAIGFATLLAILIVGFARLVTAIIGAITYGLLQIVVNNHKEDMRRKGKKAFVLDDDFEVIDTVAAIDHDEAAEDLKHLVQSVVDGMSITPTDFITIATSTPAFLGSKA